MGMKCMLGRSGDVYTAQCNNTSIKQSRSMLDITSIVSFSEHMHASAINDVKWL